MGVIDWLELSETKGIRDIDNPSVTVLHSEIILRKDYLRKIYIEYYVEFKKTINNSENRILVELGSGGGFIKQVMPKVITSDITAAGDIDLCLSGESLPFKNSSTDGFFMLNSLHHIKKTKQFFREIGRVLKAGGKILMIDPANTLWSRFIFKTFHHEDFDPRRGWGLEGAGRLSAANDALSWIIFFRDRKIFDVEFPELKVKKIRLHTPLRYLISGGVSLRQLFPSWSYQAVKGLEYLLSPLNSHIGMFMSVELERV